MLNYIRAEFYKVFHRSYARFLFAAIPVLVLCYLVMMVFANLRSEAVEWTYHGMVNLCIEFLPLGFLATLFTCDMVFAGQYRRGTLKNEVGYGLPRSRTYLGKLLTQTAVSILLCILVVIVAIGIGWFLFPHEGLPMVSGVPAEAHDRYYLQQFFYLLAVAFPLWLGVQAAVCAAFFLFRHELAAVGVLVILVEFLDDIIEWFFAVMLPNNTEAALAVYGFEGKWLPRKLLFCAQFGAQKLWEGDVPAAMAYIRQAWVTGAVWFVVFTIIGLVGFYKKEIK